jgi:galactokinase
MDQAASVFPVEGSAVYISFVPSLTARPVTFPKTSPEFAILIAQSFVTSDKAVTAPKCYNLRVVEDSMAALFLSKILKLSKPLPKDAGPLGLSLRGFHDTYFQEKEGVADNSKVSVDEFREQLGKLIKLVEDYVVQEEGYTREELAEIMGLSLPEIEQTFMTKYKVEADRFKLRQRALHVFTEARRVGDFYALLESASKNDSVGEDVLTQLGDLMNQTQDSCRDVYECSCPELDDLCAIARKAGSYGSRLTGAGWGGCCVHLVPKDKVEAIKQGWIDGYYKKHWPDITPEKLDEAIVVSQPGSGSAVYKVVDGVA